MTTYSVHIFSMSGELLNDEYTLIRHPLAPFDPSKQYEVRMSWKGAEVVGEWDETYESKARSVEATTNSADAAHKAGSSD